MKLILSTHNVTLTKSIEDHVVKRIQKLDHFDQRAIDARVTLEQDHTELGFECVHPSRRFVAPFERFGLAQVRAVRG